MAWRHVFMIIVTLQLLNYFARVRTENTIRKKYLWLNMLFEIKKYVHICFDCQRVRVHHYKLYDKFKFILSNDGNLFYIMIINFISDMSSTKNSYINKICDAILILTNKLTKYAIYIAIIKELNANNFANYFNMNLSRIIT